jgi:hypothetical protein
VSRGADAGVGAGAGAGAGASAVRRFRELSPVRPCPVACEACPDRLGLLAKAAAAARPACSASAQKKLNQY